PRALHSFPTRRSFRSGLAFALVPTTSRYAQEARPYAFTILFAILATLVLTWLLDRPGRLSGAAYAGSVALLGAAHLVAVLLLVRSEEHTSELQSPYDL